MAIDVTLLPPTLKYLEYITSGRAVEKYGKSLVGRRIVAPTWAEGGQGFTGGLCRVIGLYHDPAAPEIVFQVITERENEECGMFDAEVIAILHE